MNQAELAAIVQATTKTNLASFHSKFGPRSLDAPIFEDGGTTLKDRLAQSRYDDGVDDSRCDLFYDQMTIVEDATRRREHAEAGRGWISTLDRRGL